MKPVAPATPSPRPPGLRPPGATSPWWPLLLPLRHHHPLLVDRLVLVLMQLAGDGCRDRHRNVTVNLCPEHRSPATTQAAPTCSPAPSINASRGRAHAVGRGSARGQPSRSAQRSSSAATTGPATSAASQAPTKQTTSSPSAKAARITSATWQPSTRHLAIETRHRLKQGEQDSNDRWPPLQPTR